MEMGACASDCEAKQDSSRICITFRRVVLGPCSMPECSVFKYNQCGKRKWPFCQYSAGQNAKQAYLTGKDVILNLSASDVKANKLHLLGHCVILGNGPA